MSTSSDGPSSPNHPAVRGDHAATIAAANAGSLAAPPIAERCDHCGAGVDARQRYCVQCGAHQRRADDPAARWFASARRAKLAPAALPVGSAPAAAGRTIPAGVAALLIALLPVAAGVGVIVGRGSDNSGQQVVEALKAAGASGGLVAAGGTQHAAAGTGDAAEPADDDAKAAGDDEAKTTAKQDGVELTDEQAPVIASGPTGSARRLTGTKPTEKDLDESKDALKQIEAKKGDEYVEQQRDLPDTIVVP